MQVLDGASREAPVQLLPVQPSDVRRGERLELHAAQGRDEVHPHKPGVGFVRYGLDSTLYRVFKPTGHVLPYGQLTGVKN